MIGLIGILGSVKAGRFVQGRFGLEETATDTMTTTKSPVKAAEETTTDTTEAPTDQDNLPVGTFCPGNFLTKNTVKRNLIVGGKVARDHSWNFLVGLNYHYPDGTQKVDCSGAILNEEWILTAAHCYHGFMISPSEVLPGMLNSKEWKANGVVPRKILKSVFHPKYNKDANTGYDIALLQVEPMTLDNHTVAPVCLPQNNEGIMDRFSALDAPYCYFAGWGTIGDWDEYPDLLHTRKAKIITQETCETDMRQRSPTTWDQIDFSVQICVKKGSGVDLRSSCNGDAGAPLVCIENGQPIVVGVNSWGQDKKDPRPPDMSQGTNCASQFPDFMSKVDIVIDWIAETTGYTTDTGDAGGHSNTAGWWAATASLVTMVAYLL